MGQGRRRRIQECVPADLEVDDGHGDRVGGDDHGAARLADRCPVLGSDRDRWFEVDADVRLFSRRKASGPSLHVEHLDVIVAARCGVHGDDVQLGGALDDDEALQEVAVGSCQLVDVRAVDLEASSGPSSTS